MFQFARRTRWKWVWVVPAVVVLFPTRLEAVAPRALAVPAVEPVKIDGVGDESSWQNATWPGDFVALARSAQELAQPKHAAAQTRFKVLVDDSFVYVLIECDEPNIDRIQAEVHNRNGAVWHDDCVEIFFDPHGTGQDYISGRREQPRRDLRHARQ